ncbi:CPA1 family monovalent cation:H+ antiporter [Sphingomonas kaistensis]|uniref:CPA1 family monovalent cation:H+ antiporter n=1 Tax=Sphingomonas kaistensis TaxID=298708 RepID=A0A7X6BHC8_9SPHN|nr:sodium:proton antiporter [Sphingomonas kaistensis]NJC06833.1 CPA1 family monovalent cation:H+ antiporter [Sphingomonas kaistensis]
MHLTIFDAAAILIVLTALFAYLNLRFVKLPRSVGLTIMGALGAFAVIGLDRLLPESRLGEEVIGFIAGIDFHRTLMEGMLSFLLFAGGLHVSWSDLRRARWPVLGLSTIGVLLSTGIVGGGFYALAQLVGIPISLIWCLVFGALISPTDPIAVMDVLKRAEVGDTLKATVAGESLFNDGVGVVVFGILLAAAVSGETLSLASAGGYFMREAVGGLVLGLLTGWIAFRAMRSIDDYQTEVLISLALVMGGYALSHWIGVSGPVAMATAGLVIGNAGVAHAMSDTTRDYLLKFWSLIDDILNAILFLLIGLEVVTIDLESGSLLLGLLVIPLLLAARTLSVLGPLTAMRPLLDLGRLAPPILIWGGLRGGISVALALSLPFTEQRSPLLAATYFVVLFAVIVQGGTIAWLIEWQKRKAAG